MDEDEEKNRLFSDHNEKITLPDQNEPNFNEMKELNSWIKSTCILFDFVISSSSGFISHLPKPD